MHTQTIIQLPLLPGLVCPETGNDISELIANGEDVTEIDGILYDSSAVFLTYEGDYVFQSNIDNGEYVYDTDGDLIRIDDAVFIASREQYYHSGYHDIVYPYDGNEAELARDCHYSRYHEYHILADDEDFVYVATADDYIHTDDVLVCPRCHCNYIESSECCPESDIGHIIDAYGDYAADYSAPGTRIGIELEVELCGASAEDAADCLCTHMPDAGYITEDASLSNGFEFVVNPYTYEDFMSLPWRELLTSLSRVGCRAYEPDTCGLHVHITRPDNYTESAMIERLASIIISGRQWYAGFSCRTSDKMEKYARIPTSVQETEYAFDTQYDLRPWHTKKFSCINFLHGNTIEFRLWRGTLSVPRFLASVQLSYALCDYAFSRFEHKCTHKRFMAWLMKQDKYLELQQYIKDKGILCV